MAIDEPGLGRPRDEFLDQLAPFIDVHADDMRGMAADDQRLAAVLMLPDQTVHLVRIVVLVRPVLWRRGQARLAHRVRDAVDDLKPGDTFLGLLWQLVVRL